MANLDIQIGGKTVNVDIAGFENMSPADQNAAVDNVSNSLSPSFMGDLSGGAHDLGTGLSQTANVIGGVLSRNDFPNAGAAVSGAGQWIGDHTPAAPADNSTSDLTSAVSDGRWGDALSALPHAALRASVSTAPILAAGAVPGVGEALAGGMAGAESLGPTAYQRAVNNGRDTPDTSDVEGALPSTVVQAGLGSVMPGGAAGSIANPILRAGAKVGIEAATGAGMDAAGQLGGSVGTDAGTQFNPAEMAAVGLTQGALGAARGVAPLPGAAVKAASDDIMSRVGSQPVSDADAQSMARVGDAYDAQLQAVQNTRGGTIRPTDVLNNLKNETLASTMSYARDLLGAGIMSQDLFRDVQTVTNNQAARHNNEIVDSGGPDTSSLFDGIKNSGIDASTLQPLLNGIRDLNTLSKQSFLKNQTGPFQRLGNVASQVGAIGGMAAHGNIPGMIGVALGHGAVGKLGGGVGSALDGLLGTNTPPILLQRLAANRYLAAKGLDAGPATLPSLANASNSIPPPVPPTPPAPSSLALLQRIRGQAQSAFDASNNPNPAPAFIRPQVDAPAPNPAPAFIRPQVDAPTPAPAPVPPFIRPQVAPPPPSIRPQEADPETGLPPSPIPVNQPIPASVRTPASAPSVSTLPPLRLDTRATVNAALGDAEGELGIPRAQRPVESPGESVGLPAPTPAAGSSATPGVPSGPAPAMSLNVPASQGRGWEQYVAQKVPGVTRQAVHDAVDAVHTPEVAAWLKQQSGAGAEYLKPVQDHLLANGGAGGKPVTSDPVRNPRAYAANLAQEANAYQTIVTNHPQLRGVADAIRDPSANGKTSAGRKAILADILSKVADPLQRKALSDALTPLTGYGQK